MAKDVSHKTSSISTTNDNNTNSSSTIADQQKVPPLRIVLNTAGNQKTTSTSSSTTLAVTSESQPPTQATQQSQESKRSEKDGKSENNSIKTGGRVRIKLGTNKQTTGKSGATNYTDSTTTANSRLNSNNTELNKQIEKQQDNNTNSAKEEINANFNHLRRITRRSQRTIQTVSNEDEESISSMTSVDENQNSTNNNSSDNNASSQDATQATSNSTTNNNQLVTGTSTTISNSNIAGASSTPASNNNNNSEQPRRCKRRKGETSESLSGEHEGPFGYQNYKLPNQNSFELFKNIRKQVDKKLNNLNSIIQPKTPYGFRDYMMRKGAYLLDGNKLGNGTYLFMNEEGGLDTAPMGKYHALRRNKVNYSVPNRAKVPLGLPINSPLYNLFIEQEKERYRMRMQHIKEREKLTLAAEQEIIRVYNQAALTAANQLEPFSACTMLKHQEIYNYMDSDGVTILSNEDAQQEQAGNNKDALPNTRTRHHEQLEITPTRNTDTCNIEKSSTSLDQPTATTVNHHQQATKEATGKDSDLILNQDESQTAVDRVEEVTRKQVVEQVVNVKKEKTVPSSSSSSNDGDESKDSEVGGDKGKKTITTTTTTAKVTDDSKEEEEAKVKEKKDGEEKEVLEKNDEITLVEETTKSKNENVTTTPVKQTELKLESVTPDIVDEVDISVESAEKVPINIDLVDKQEQESTKTTNKESEEIGTKKETTDETTNIKDTNEDAEDTSSIETSKKEATSIKEESDSGSNIKQQNNDDAVKDDVVSSCEQQAEKSSSGSSNSNDTKKPEHETGTGDEASQSIDETSSLPEQPKEADDLMNASATTEIVMETNQSDISNNQNSNVVPMEQDTMDLEGTQQQAQDEQHEKQLEEASIVQQQVLSDDDRRAQNKEIFLNQLQEIDDKWDRIKSEMLIRHRNEAESLHAVQKLEWEWKTKEIGACDVRTTPIIDDTLVPMITIYTQDY